MIAVDSSTWTGRGPAYTGRTLRDLMPEQRKICRFVVTVEWPCDSDGSPEGRDREAGLDGEAATARAEGIARGDNP
jgi:hypothetical protein